MFTSRLNLHFPGRVSGLSQKTQDDLNHKVIRCLATNENPFKNKAFQWNANCLLADSMGYIENKFEHVPGWSGARLPPPRHVDRMTDTREKLPFVGGR